MQKTLNDQGEKPMKKQYDNIDISIILFDNADVITESVDPDGTPEINPGQKD